MALLNKGRDYMAAALLSNPTNLFDASKGTIGVGTSTAVYAAAQTDLQGTKAYEVVDAAPGIAVNVLTFVATFATGVANFAWEEWGVCNSTGAAPNGTTTILLNRKVETLGTKTSAQSWEITATLTVSIGT
jgi:hypothetical protein